MNLLHGNSPEIVSYLESLKIGGAKALGFNITSKGCELWVIREDNSYRVVKRKKISESVQRETLQAMLGKAIRSISFGCAANEIAVTTSIAEVTATEFNNIRSFFEAQEDQE